jgi:hypothetical protein
MSTPEAYNLQLYTSLREDRNPTLLDMPHQLLGNQRTPTAEIFRESATRYDQWLIPRSTFQQPLTPNNCDEYESK